ncbi:MAG: hypothetical protein AAFN77_19495 [Planctomycetota bacterium]
MNAETSPLKIRFIERRSEPVKHLPGFQKHHRVPTAASPNDQRFIVSLAEPLLDNDLQDKFSSLRKAFGLKRKEISVDGPFEGTGIVATPFFEYRIVVELDESTPSRVLFTRTIENIGEPARIVAAPFETVFENMFSEMEVVTESTLDLEAIVDAIEDAESAEVSIDYDKDLTWCEIQLINSASTVIVKPNSIVVSSAKETTPQQLLELFVDIQQQFVASLNLGQFAFDARQT